MMMHLRRILHPTQRRVALAALTLGFFAAYSLLDLREGGRASNLLTTRLASPSFYISQFGGWFFWGSVVLNVALAAASALLIVGSVAHYRSREAAGGVCTTTATLLFGVAVFGCPGCVMPLFGTLGLALFASALPLFGLEFKFLSLAVILGALAWLFRRPGEPAGARHLSAAPVTRRAKA